MSQRYDNLQVWQKSMDLVCETYKLISIFPLEEKFGLAQQIRRSAVSIPSNIAEGAGRKAVRDFMRFLFIALGSANELETQILLSQKLGFIAASQIDSVINRIGEIRKMLYGLIQRLDPDKSP